MIAQDPIDSIAPNLSVRENLNLAINRAKNCHNILKFTKDMTASILTKFPCYERIFGALDRPAATLSGGEIQILAVICATLDESEIILGDEPVKMLDSNYRELVEKELLQLSKRSLVLISSHHPRLDLAPIENHLYIKEKQIHQGVIKVDKFL